MSNSSWPHELQHIRLPCPSPVPGNCSNSCPSSQWCHPTISSSVIPFSSCPPSLPASGSFPMNRLFISGGQSIGAPASASVLPNTQGWFPLGLNGLISLLPKGLSRVFSCTTIWRHQLFRAVQLSQPYMTTGKKHSFDYLDLCGKVMFLLFNTLSRSKRLLISWLQSPSPVILELKKIKSKCITWI